MSRNRRSNWHSHPGLVLGSTLVNFHVTETAKKQETCAWFILQLDFSWTLGASGPALPTAELHGRGCGVGGDYSHTTAYKFAWPVSRIVKIQLGTSTVRFTRKKGAGSVLSWPIKQTLAVQLTLQEVSCCTWGAAHFPVFLKMKIKQLACSDLGIWTKGSTYRSTRPGSRNLSQRPKAKTRWSTWKMKNTVLFCFLIQQACEKGGTKIKQQHKKQQQKNRTRHKIVCKIIKPYRTGP